VGFRFRKSFKIAPGVRLNLSKSGVSTSIGGRGATLNVGGKRGARATVGIPGTGISYSEHLERRTPREQAPAGRVGLGTRSVLGIAVLLAVLIIFGLITG
jgi:hypothetical protein